MQGQGRGTITYCVLNLRMGGQVSNMHSLMRLVTQRGFDVRLALPDAVDGSKAGLSAFAAWPAAKRARALWRMVRALVGSP